jgi:hypothetical protein
MDRRTLIYRSFQALLAPALFASPGIDAQGATAQDGNWWRTINDSDHLIVLAGFVNGMELGNFLSFWGSDGSHSGCTAETVGTYLKAGKRYFSAVSLGQLRDGVDDFYNDYKNRSIRLYAAVWLVAQSIGGVPKEQLDKDIEQWRRDASNP